MSRALLVAIVSVLCYPIESARIGTQQAPPSVVLWSGGAGQVEEPALSPDARLMAYIDPATRELHVRDLGAGRSWQLTNIVASGGYVGTPVISTDSKHVAFASRIAGESGVRVLPLTEKTDVAPRLVLKGADIEPRQWVGKGDRLLVSAESGQGHQLSLVNVADGTCQLVKTVSRWSPLPFAAVSPDGTLLAFDTRVNKPTRHRSVFLIPTAGGPEVPLLDEGDWSSVLGWSPDGRFIVVFSDRGGSRGIWGIPVLEGKRAGEPRLLASNFIGVPISVTASGALFYLQATGAPAAQLYMTALDSDGRAHGSATRYRTSEEHALNRLPRWSADGKWFMYVTSRLPGATLSIASTDGNRNVREIPLNLAQVVTFDWSPDGASVAYRGIDLDGRFGILVVDLATARVRRVVTGAPSYHPQFTADSRSITHFKQIGQPNQARWIYVERNLATDAERVLHEDLRKLMSETGRNHYPAGRSPDGRFLFAITEGQPTSSLLAYDTTSDTVRELLRVEQKDAFNHNGGLTYTADSRAIVATARNANGQQDIWWVPLDERRPHIVETGIAQIAENTIAIAPDGRAMAFLAGRHLQQTMPMLPRPHYIGQPADFKLMPNLFAAGR